MRQSLINLLALIVIGMGGAYLSAPPSMAAQNFSTEACCTTPDGTECCGDSCNADADSCDADDDPVNP